MVRRACSYILAVIILIFFPFSVFAEKQNNLSDQYYFKRNNENKIALTFDDGPHPRYTEKILSILKKYDIKATFFIIGVNAENYPEPLKSIADYGHEIGNHTFTHQYVKGKSPKEILNDIESCENAIFKACGIQTVLFRPPGGLMDEIPIGATNIYDGYNIIYWSIDTMDWAHRSPDEIASYVIKNVKSGDIILMHDYIGRNSPTPEALEIMLPILIEKGFEFVTVSELINSK